MFHPCLAPKSPKRASTCFLFFSLQAICRMVNYFMLSSRLYFFFHDLLVHLAFLLFLSSLSLLFLRFLSLLVKIPCVTCKAHGISVDLLNLFTELLIIWNSFKDSVIKLIYFFMFKFYLLQHVLKNFTTICHKILIQNCLTFFYARSFIISFLKVILQNY